MPICETNEDRHWHYLWNVQLGSRYHQHMQRGYSRIGRWITIFSLMAGTSAYVAVVGTNSGGAKLAAAIIVFLQVIDLVINTKDKVAQHDSLRQQYILLEAELSASSALTIEDGAKFKARIASIELKEPPINHAVMKRTHNDLNRVHNTGQHEKWDYLGLEWLWAHCRS